MATFSPLSNFDYWSKSHCWRIALLLIHSSRSRYTVHNSDVTAGKNVCSGVLHSWDESVRISGHQTTTASYAAAAAAASERLRRSDRQQTHRSSLHPLNFSLKQTVRTRSSQSRSSSEYGATTMLNHRVSHWLCNVTG